MFFSITIIIHNVLSAPGVVRQINLSSERTPKRAAPRAALAQQDGSIASPVSGYHRAHPAADLLPTGGPARQPTGPVAIATTGWLEAGPAAGRGRGSLGCMRGTSSSPPPSIPVSQGTEGCSNWAHAQSAIGGSQPTAHAPRVRSPPSPRGCAGGAGRGPRGAEWKPEAEVPRASKPLFSPVRRLLLGCPAPAVPGPNRPDRCRLAAPPRPAPPCPLREGFPSRRPRSLEALPAPRHLARPPASPLGGHDVRQGIHVGPQKRGLG